MRQLGLLDALLAIPHTKIERLTMQWEDDLLPLADFTRLFDDYITQVHNLTPMPGYEHATLPGELEWRREQEWSTQGVPVGDEHRAILRAVGQEFGVSAPV